MDNAVALEQAYLQINGYFTVAKYPIIEATGDNHFNMTMLLLAAERNGA